MTVRAPEECGAQRSTRRGTVGGVVGETHRTAPGDLGHKGRDGRVDSECR